MRIQISQVRRIGDSVEITINYRFPARNFHIKKENDLYHGAYLYRWVIYDEDYRALKTSEAVEEIHYQDQKQWKGSTIEGTITTTLAQGSYVLALRIEDLLSTTKGIYRKHFGTRPKL
jgi:hypothetical protein